MSPDAPEVVAFIGRAMVARIATRSARGTPQIMPLWFVRAGGKLLMTNNETSPTVRNIAADPRVVVMLDADRHNDGRCLRIVGTARFRSERSALMRTVLRDLLKYHLAPAALWSAVRHPRQVPSMLRYYIERRDGGVIEVSPSDAEFLALPPRA
jgi:nitroimidazol reductase NimA-like FMN-containing flavoprotein (pyridoxamine 5'-phosphate oxidase superfamily)